MKRSTVYVYFAHNKRSRCPLTGAKCLDCCGYAAFRAGKTNRGKDKHSLTVLWTKSIFVPKNPCLEGQLRPGASSMDPAAKLWFILLPHRPCGDLKPAWTQAGSGDWFLMITVFLLQTEYKLYNDTDCNMQRFVFILWVFVQIYNGVAITDNQMQFNRPTFQFWLIWLHPWLPWQQQVRFNTTGPRILGGSKYSMSAVSVYRVAKQ